MRPTPALQRSIAPTLLIGSALLLVGGVGAVGILWARGHIDLPFFKHPVQAPSYEGLVPVPVSAVVIPAYARVTRDHLIDPKTAAVKVVYLPPEAVKTSVFTDVSRIMNRVTAREKPAGYAFKEEDFLPPGTPPGLAGGTPLGMVALAVEADNIQGIHALKQGDQFDLFGSPMGEAGKMLGNRSRDSSAPLALRYALVKVLVKDGVMVSPIHTRQVPIPGKSSRGGPPPTRPVQFIEIAVAPGEVGPLTAALAMKVDVRCVAHSGRKGSGGREDGLVPVPVSAAAIPAYSQITRDQVLDPAVMAIRLPREFLKPSLCIDVNRIIGRVLARDKVSGDPFEESDFLPLGTPPGLAGATPPGMVALALEADRIKGIQALQQGNHFDLLGAALVEEKKAGPGNHLIALPGSRPLSGQRVLLRLLVRDGIVLLPPHPVQAPATGASGGSASTRPVQYVQIAVAAEDAGPLTAAVAARADLMCVARSSRKGPDGQSVGVEMPAAPPPGNVTVEVIVGKKREYVEFATPPEQPPVAWPARQFPVPGGRPAPAEPRPQLAKGVQP